MHPTFSRTRALLFFTGLALGGCGGGTTDTPVPDAGAPTLPAWERGLAATKDLYPVRRGLRQVRGLIHFHSVNSHDACDGKPRPNGQPAEPCNHDLRDGLCATRQDYGMLTDHDDNMADHPWDELFTPLPGDEKVMVDGKHVASWLACPDGHRVLLQIGGENGVMPIGLDEEVAPDAPTRHDIMNGTDAAAIASFRAHGALVAFAHTESKPADQLRAAKADATEVYNLHANLDPRLRELMGLDPAGAIVGLGPFLSPRDDGPVPDLAFLGFAETLPAEWGPYHTILSEGTRLTGTAGTDAHQNVFSGLMADGERGDSYRRMMRWFSNHLLLDELTPAKVKAAIKGGRLFVVFEVFGPARGFDVRTETKKGVAEIGDEVALADAPEIVVEAPRADLVAGQDAPALKVKIVLADRPEGTEVASGDGSAPLRFKPTKPGAYRVEVRVLPNHLVGYMGSAKAKLLREFAWVLANPIYVK